MWTKTKSPGTFYPMGKCCLRDFHFSHQKICYFSQRFWYNLDSVFKEDNCSTFFKIIIIIIIIILLLLHHHHYFLFIYFSSRLVNFSHQLIVFCWSLSDSKSSRLFQYSNRPVWSRFFLWFPVPLVSFLSS